MNVAKKANELAPVSDLGNSREEVDVVVKVDERVNIHPVEPAQSPTSFASNSPNGKTTGTVGLRAWLAASKAALAASQADQRETQRRISRLQEATNDLNIIDFASQAESKAGCSESGVGDGDDRAGHKARSPKDKSCSGEESTESVRHLRQLHCMPLGVIGGVVSFLEPRSILRYGLACKAVEDVLRQDECWGGIFRVLHLQSDIIGVPHGSLGGAENHRASQNEEIKAPMRAAVIARGRSLSLALRLFDAVVLDGGVSKAVINGPVHTAAAVASLRGLVEITANVFDTVGRLAFSDARTGQVLLSIIAREHGNATLQDLACAALANLFCEPEGSGSAEQPLALDMPCGSAAAKMLGRNKGPAVQALTALCSSTRPSPSSWSAPKVGGGGMRPVENLPGRQASRALINLLLPKCQVLQQETLRGGGFGADYGCSNARRHSLPSIVPQKAASAGQSFGPQTATSAGQSSGTAAGFSTECGSCSRRTSAPAAAAVMAWQEETKDGMVAVSIATSTRGKEAPSDFKHERAPDERPVGVDAESGGPVRLPTIGGLEDHDAVPILSKNVSTQGPGAMRTAGMPLRQQATASPTTAEAAAPRLDEKAEAGGLASSTLKAPQETPTTPLSIPPGAALELGAASASRFPETQRRYGNTEAVQTKTVDDGCRDARGSMGPEPPPAPGIPCNTCLALPCREQRPEEEVWEAFYFYQRGGIKDNFNVRLKTSMPPGGGFSGHGVDKLGHFVMEGSPLLDRGAGDTWFISKTYTGRGLPQGTTDRVSASTSVAGHGPGRSAHVTHMAYLTDDLSNGKHGVGNKGTTSWFAEAAPAATGVATADDAPPETDASHVVTRASPLAEPALAATWRHGNPPAANVGNARRHSGFWGVWEPVLGLAGDVGGQSTAHGLSSRWRTTLSRRGGVFRLVPSRGTP
ncbi:unnamed protein product [Ectocarpus sp. 6 AP-2014]